MTSGLYRAQDGLLLCLSLISLSLLLLSLLLSLLLFRLEDAARGALPAVPGRARDEPQDRSYIIFIITMITIIIITSIIIIITSSSSSSSSSSMLDIFRWLVPRARARDESEDRPPRLDAGDFFRTMIVRRGEGTAD